MQPYVFLPAPPPLQPASTQNHSQSHLPDGVQVVFKQEKLLWNVQTYSIHWY